QQGEDVGLQHDDDELEQRHGDAQREREDRHALDEDVARVQQLESAEDEHQEDEVAGEHVREQSQGQRDRAQQDVLEELERDQQRQDERRRPRRNAGHLQ